MSDKNKGTKHIVATSSDEAKLTCESRCKSCKGSLPWIETNPHAHKANGKICKKCGHFYPFQHGKNRLRKYCRKGKWDKAMHRLAYAPNEACDVERSDNSTALTLAIEHAGPLPLIQALSIANPNAVTMKLKYIGFLENCERNPLWFVLDETWHGERQFEICRILLNAKNAALFQACFSYWTHEFESIISRHAADFFSLVDVAALPDDCTMEDLFAATKPYLPGSRAISGGEIRNAFNLLSLFIKADYHGYMDDQILSSSLLHAVAGCRDPFFEHAQRSLRVLQLLARWSPQQLLETDPNGRCPLHIAASTTNRNKSAYDGYGDDDDAMEEFKKDEQARFMRSCSHGCPHWRSSCKEFFNMIDGPCECNIVHEEGKHAGCQECLDGTDSICKHCFEKYPEVNRYCHKQFELAQRECKCPEAFEYWFAKMYNEHRDDKKDVIQALTASCPTSAAIPDKLGFLPIHLAVASGKCWDSGVRAIAEAFPDGVGMKDPQTNLYPFMMAASLENLDTTVELLRFLPDVFLGCTVMPAETAWQRGQKRKFSATIKNE